MRHFLLLITFALALGFNSPGQSAEAPSEVKLKAAYLYNFAKFIHWPEYVFVNKTSPLVIGVLGASPLYEELIPLAARTVRNRPITVEYFATLDTVQHCHLLYISPSVSGSLQSVLKNLHSTPIITVGDDRAFAESGGTIQFVTKRGRLRFIVNLETAQANGIKIDSQLLSLAVEIIGTGK